ncbi:MAG TPA: HAMP domain-containing histidine kinase, partial [Candidatus Mediterraneibacter cottocaccae]|nr:HAMP domain-containing histidine kinase [Candidatus Mediterraneibacter cottocaccae]
KELLDLSLITEMAVEEQADMAQAKGIRIETDIQEGIEGYVDETLFIRLWMNLIGNGISYGKKGGWLKVGLKEENGRACGCVEDNGIGISEEQLPHIWERFYQADSSRTGKENAGSGLGLPIVKWIVEIHGGEISVESVPGKGSRFCFFIPLSKKQGENY